MSLFTYLTCYSNTMQWFFHINMYRWNQRSLFKPTQRYLTEISFPPSYIPSALHDDHNYYGYKSSCLPRAKLAQASALTISLKDITLLQKIVRTGPLRTWSKQFHPQSILYQDVLLGCSNSLTLRPSRTPTTVINSWLNNLIIGYNFFWVFYLGTSELMSILDRIYAYSHL